MGCLSTQVLYLWAVKDSRSDAEPRVSPYGGCRTRCLFCSRLVTGVTCRGAGPEGWQGTGASSCLLLMQSPRLSQHRAFAEQPRADLAETVSFST